MRTTFAAMFVVCMLRSSSSWAQQPSMPSTYVVAMEAHIPGLDRPLNFTVYRDGSRERIDLGEGSHLFDFDAHKYYEYGLIAGQQIGRAHV